MKKLPLKLKIMIAAVPVLVLVLVLVKMNQNKTSQQIENKEMALPEISENDSLTKTEIYANHGDEPTRKKNIPWDEWLKRKKEEKKKDTIKDTVTKVMGEQLFDKKPKKKKKPEPEKVKVVYRDRSQRKPEPKEKKEVVVGGLGVYHNKNINSNQGQSFNSAGAEKAEKLQTARMEGFVKARFEKDYVLKDKSEVVLINQEDFSYRGVVIKKFALFFGQVEFDGTRFHIRINTVKNTDNAKYRLQYSLFNTQYQKGLYYDNPQAKQESKEVVDEGVSDVTRQNVKTKVVTSAIDKLTTPRTREHKKHVNEGDLVYLKAEPR